LCITALVVDPSDPLILYARRRQCSGADGGERSSTAFNGYVTVLPI
jgi:hypothetical protein